MRQNPLPSTSAPIKFFAPESMLKDLQEKAHSEDRSLSEIVRHALSIYLYGIVGTGKESGLTVPKGSTQQLHDNNKKQA